MRRLGFLSLLLLWACCAQAAITTPCIFNATVPASSPFTATCPVSFGTGKGVLVLANGNAVAGAGDQYITHARFSPGFADGTNRFTLSAVNTDAASSDDSHTYFSTAHVILDQFNGGTLDGAYTIHASTPFPTDGVQFSASDPSATAFEASFVLFGGSDLTVQVGSFTANATNGSTTTINTVGFKPDLVLLTSAYTATAATNTDDSKFCIGAAIQVNDVITQGSIGMFADDAALDSVVGQLVEDRYACAHLTAAVASTTAQQAVELGTFSSSGFVATSRVESVANGTYGYMAFHLGGKKRPFLIPIDSPTAIGTYTIPVPGITPEFAMLFMATAKARQTGEADEDANSMSLANFNATQTATIGYTIEDNEITMDAESTFHHTGIMHLRSDSGVDLHECTLTSLTAGQITLNCTVAHATARKWFVVGWGSAGRRRAWATHE